MGYYILVALVFFVAGWIVSFFVMRNNPKYFNVDKMAKDELLDLYNKVKGKVGG